MTGYHALITGGAGFIGSHLAERLLQQGCRVTVLDDLSTGDYANVARLEELSEMTLVIDTVFNEPLTADLIRNCDRVFHLASAVGVKLIMDRPVHTIENIFGATDIVLRNCARYRKKVLLTSTSEVYGKGVAVPFREDDDVLTGSTSKHRWAYACAKALDEFLALAHWRESRLPVSVVRLFNTVGPRQSGQYGMVVPRFVAAALAGEPLQVYGDGLQSRCFAHVDDVVSGLIAAIDQPACYGQVVNIGNDEEVTIQQLAERIIQQTNSSSKIVATPYDQAYGEGFEDMLRRVPSLEKAQRLLGYEPKLNLERIIADVTAWLLESVRPPG
ncbi:NAD-dependent epimerase/dehydratase family protein [Lignipirellula cremea]|uniref:Bifunctional polymyxin resistance protein ArnA n=1 Tax=Lignipirellula cremea TaxID=2528010 RepID=A0A518DX33_9BACT|nr:NAD-dependent epimerase/dehydratase family protein [Lignipirellula cremea]QDU96403.1 Bifunctional polymyxin resistance protein ArnA [Lignipirellula cremea]